jgi:hypothetical protein
MAVKVSRPGVCWISLLSDGVEGLTGVRTPAYGYYMNTATNIAAEASVDQGMTAPWVVGYAIRRGDDEYMGPFDTEKDARLTARAYGNAPVVAVCRDGRVVAIR